MLRIYIKTPDASRYRAMDYRRGVPVANLIYATLFEMEQRGQVESAVDYMRCENPNYRFEIREAS